MMVMKSYRGFFTLIACAIIFSVFNVFIRVLNIDLTTYQQIAFRNAIAFVLSVGVIVMLKPKLGYTKVSWKVLLLYAITFPITVILFTFAVLQTKIATATFGLYIGTITASQLIGYFFFKEKLTKQHSICLALVITGLIFFSYPFSFSSLNAGFWLSVSAGVIDAVSNTLRRFLGGKIDRFALVPIPMIGGLVIATILAMQSGQPIIPASISPLSWIVGLLFGAALLGINYLMLVGFQNISLHLGTLVLSSELFFGLLIGMLLYKEVPTKLELLGGIFIILGVIYMNIDFKSLASKSKKHIVKFK
jgi:drug/metabolite transporter (DMT)-like permease